MMMTNTFIEGTVKIPNGFLYFTFSFAILLYIHQAFAIDMHGT